MDNSTKTELRRENDRLKAELAKLKNGPDDPLASKVQSDLWTHEIYLSARKKMTIGVVAVLTIVGLASGGSLYLEYKEVTKWMELELKKSMKEQINNEISNKIELQKPEIDKIIKSGMADLSDTLTTQLEAAKTKIDAQIDVLKEETKTIKVAFDKKKKSIDKNLVDLKVQTDSAVEKIKQTVIGAEQSTLDTTAKVDVYLQKDQTVSIAKAQCDNQIAKGENYSIKQLVSKTDKTYKDRPYYKNSFSVAAVGDNKKEYSTATTECFVDAVDRVVYSLNERWFKPNRIVRITRNDRYSFSTNVWGSTAVKAEIYLKGSSEPIHRCGRFVAKIVTDDNPEFFTEANCPS